MSDQKPLKLVGSRPVRPDGVNKVTGRARFGADIVLPNMLHGRVLRSPHAHAWIKSIDTSKPKRFRVCVRLLPLLISLKCHPKWCPLAK